MNKVFSDTQMLDFLQTENDKARYTGRCVYRLSTTGRGWRLHEHSGEGAHESVREALTEAMLREAVTAER